MHTTYPELLYQPKNNLDGGGGVVSDTPLDLHLIFNKKNTWLRLEPGGFGL